MTYCTCEKCRSGDIIENPFSLFRTEIEIDRLGLVFDRRTSMLCRYGCAKYCKKPTCPPNIPAQFYYEQVFKEYNMVSVLGRKYPYSDGNFQDHWRQYSTNEIHHLLLQRERELFMQGHIYAKAFIGGSCKICPDGSCDVQRCRIPHKGRVPLEATGVNVYSILTNLNQAYQEPPIDYFWRIGMVFY